MNIGRSSRGLAFPRYIEPTRVYNVEDAREFLKGAGIAVEEIAPLVDGKILSAFIRAKKPAIVCCDGNCPCNA